MSKRRAGMDRMRARADRRIAAGRTAGGGPDMRRALVVHQAVHMRRAAARDYQAALGAAADAYHGGAVTYHALRAADGADGAAMAREVQAHLAALTKGDPAGPQEPAVLRAAADALQALHQGWIDAGRLVLAPLRLLAVPLARRHADGRVEAVDRLGDPDIAQIAGVIDRIRARFDRRLTTQES